jgi:threonine/homoserine/homoserine lactone efflux protein
LHLPPRSAQVWPDIGRDLGWEMEQTLLTGLVLFALVSSITPGPNNMMLMASGANFGFRRTLPHMMGVVLGFTLMVALVGVGLMGVFQALPWLHDVLTWAGIAYLMWLAWKIAHAAMPDATRASGQPLSFLQACAFQWVNPKGWQMALTAITLYAPDRALWAVLLVAGSFGVVNLPSVAAWTFLGLRLRRILSTNRRLVIFNWSMALLLIASLLPVAYRM